LIIGAQKAGTTWLQRNLQAHPDIWMPEIKELHYFDEKIRLEGGLLSRLRNDGLADARWRRQIRGRLKKAPSKFSLQDAAWDLKYFLGKPDDAWYASLFERGRDKVTGETTPDYSVLPPKTIAHVHDIMPDAKIIFMMRSPIERPWSAMDMRFRTSGGTLEEVRDRKLYRQFDRKRMRQMTDYLRTLENWGSFYPEGQIFVGFLEDVHFFPEELLERLYGFLGIDVTVRSEALRYKVHSSSQSTMPTRFAVHLARSYQEEIEALAERFGGYATFWLHCVERLTEELSQEEQQVPYPLWRSRFWEEWEGSRELATQSGPLSSVQISP